MRRRPTDLVQQRRYLVLPAAMTGTLLPLLTGCGNDMPFAAPQTTPVAIVASPAASTAALAIVQPWQADEQVVACFPQESKALGVAGSQTDSNGLIGRNREWGGLFSPRFQSGAGLAVRIGLVAGDMAMVENGFRALEAGLDAVEADGSIPSTLPAELLDGQTPSDADVASAGAFFLADICPALLSVSTHPRADQAIARERRDRAAEVAAKAAEWLLKQEDLLLEADRHAPNRLLIDAVALHTCGKLADNAQVRQSASAFVVAALENIRPDGSFAEGGGFDTNYQAVALVQLTTLSITDYRGEGAEAARAAWDRGSDWLTGRIMPDGAINTAGDARSCGGGETFLGEAKLASPAKVFEALAYYGVLTGNARALAAAARLAKWVRDNPGVNPCQ